MSSGISKDLMDLDAYYNHIQTVYDDLAPLYDEAVGLHAVSRRAKATALEAVKKLTPPGGRLLDIGCYTGIEALILAQKGFRVVGIDISPGMINIARKKAKRLRLEGRLRFEVLKASDLSLLRDDPQEPFDTAYSVYGTLNLEPQISQFKSSLISLLSKDGFFVCGLLNPTVLYELLIAPLLLKFRGFRKLAKRGVRTSVVGKHIVETFLYSPSEFAALMGPEFKLQQTMGLHFLYPPPRGKGGHGLWWVARAADRFEEPLENHFPFSSLGFFSLLVFRKVQD